MWAMKDCFCTPLNYVLVKCKVQYRSYKQKSFKILKIHLIFQLKRCAFEAFVICCLFFKIEYICTYYLLYNKQKRRRIKKYCSDGGWSLYHGYKVKPELFLRFLRPLFQSEKINIFRWVGPSHGRTFSSVVFRNNFYKVRRIYLLLLLLDRYLCLACFGGYVGCVVQFCDTRVRGLPGIFYQ